MPQNNNIDISVLNGLIVGRVEPQIYAFSTQTVPNYLKVGDTYRPLEIRLNEWRKYFPNLEKQFADLAKADSETFFRDFAVHYFLENEQHKNRLKPDTFADLPYFSNEFFENTRVQDVKEAIEDIKDSHSKNNGKYQFYKFDENRIRRTTLTYQRIENYEPRPNQQETICNFRKAIEKGRTNLLMYAVMRFGKSFTSMCCATEIQAKVVIIVSAKADVKEEWKKTIESHTRFTDYVFLDSNSLLESDSVISDTLNKNKKVAVFLTLQDLQGDEIKSKHKEIFETQIDLLIVDETHFGARASEYGKVLQELSAKEQRNENKQNDSTLDELETIIKVLNAQVRLHLSGTPYRILMGSEFSDDDIIAFYQFSDIVEDLEHWNAENLNKDDVKEWDNPYYGFPQMVRFAFNPNESSRKKMEELRKNGVTYTFSALFKPKSITKDNANQNHKKFEHEREILDLLEVIDGTKSDKNLLGFLNYDKIKDGKMCRHIVCVLPYRASCDALENLILTNKSRFKNLNEYEIVNIAGVDNERQYKDTQLVKTKIKSCEAEGKKTITLTVNRMLTGSTVEEWDTMLYFKDTASPQEYDQAVFRLQNQHIKTYVSENDDVIKYNMKPQTLLVDFDPNRMFRMQEQKSQIYNVNTDKNGNTKLEERIKRELEISPIVVLNNNKIVQVVPADVLDAVRKYSSDKSVLDEATAIPVDFSLLTNEQIRTEIEKQGKIGSKQGLEVTTTEGEGEDIDVPTSETESTESPITEETNPETTTPVSETEENDFKGKFAMYYAKILFFAFLTDCEIKSLQEIINHIDTSENNKRIATSLDLNKDILVLLQTKINPFILSKLDYKIHNINTLANDKSLQPIDRASNAMKKFSRLSISEVVTPEKVTDDMLALFPTGAINENTMILDIAAKQGEFVYAVYKKFGKKVAENFYSIPTSKIAYEFTRKVYELLGLDVLHIVSEYTTYDLLKTDKEIIKNNKILIGGKYMNLDVIIGNPPYQEGISKNEGNKSLSKQLFPKFIELVVSMHPNYCSLITPTRWFTADAQDNSFPKLRKFIKENNHIRKFAIREGHKVFPMVTIPGTVGYFLYDSNYQKDKVEFDENDDGTKSIRPLFEQGLDIILDSHIKADILNKVVSRSNGKYLTEMTTGRDAFGFSGNKDFVNNHSEKQVFPDCAKLKTVEGIRYIKKDSIADNREIFENYKVFISKADGAAGLIGDRDKEGKIKQSRIIGKNVVALPYEACTDTYIPIGNFDNKTEAENLSKYLKTRFLRFMVGIMKTSQNLYQIVYKFVPIQDFTANSDIDWTKSIDEIDEQLFEKYALSIEQIEFIKQTIARFQ
jgi:hypothetical protein